MSRVVQVCECVVILKNLKDVSWTGAKSMMTDPGFLKSLVEFDKDGLTEKQVKRVKTEYMKDPSFTYDNIRNVSTAGAGAIVRTVCSRERLCVHCTVAQLLAPCMLYSSCQHWPSHPDACTAYSRWLKCVG